MTGRTQAEDQVVAAVWLAVARYVENGCGMHVTAERAQTFLDISERIEKQARRIARGDG